MRNKWQPYLCYYLTILSSACLFPPQVLKYWKQHWFKRRWTVHTDTTNKRTNEQLDWKKLWGRSGSTTLVFDNNAWSLCSLHRWASCFHFSSAQLSAELATHSSTWTQTHGMCSFRHVCKIVYNFGNSNYQCLVIWLIYKWWHLQWEEEREEGECRLEIRWQPYWPPKRSFLLYSVQTSQTSILRRDMNAMNK